MWQERQLLLFASKGIGHVFLALKIVLQLFDLRRGKLVDVHEVVLPGVIVAPALV
jgi:hypothetical protein